MKAAVLHSPSSAHHNRNDLICTSAAGRLGVFKWLLTRILRRREMDMAMRGVVADRVKALQQLDLSALKALPAQMKEAVPSLGKVQIIQYHEVTNTGEHMLVVQALRQRWLGLFTAIEVDGFVIVPDGTKRALLEQEKWAFT
jgi:hypothetical protein